MKQHLSCERELGLALRPAQRSLPDGGLGKVVVVLPDGMKRLRRQQADHVVGSNHPAARWRTAKGSCSDPHGVRIVLASDHWIR